MTRIPKRQDVHLLVLLMILLWLILLVASEGSAADSTLELEVIGEGSGGREATISEVEQQARADAMRKALEMAGVQLASVTQVDLAEVTRDEVTAWSRGLVRVIDVVACKTIFDEKMKTFRCDVRLKVAVDLGSMASLMSQVKETRGGPAAQPLTFAYRFAIFRPNSQVGSSTTQLYAGDEVCEGDEFQIWFQPDAPCYAYVINRDASGAVYVLFPHEQSVGNKLTGGQGYSLPGEGRAYRFDSVTGLETFYLVVSPVEMPDLAWMIRRMDREGHGEVAAMLDGTLRARGMRGAGTVVSRQNMKGEEADGSFAEEGIERFKGSGAMVRVFTLNHR
ncbi:MAG: DUF4384 domain-containing protein [bacterium]|nr:DUF4384 domain-containing protein [bacterium]